MPSASIPQNVAPGPRSVPGPALDAVAQTASRISVRRPELATSEPEAVALAAEALAALHGQLAGAMTSVRGPRRGRYARGQVVGERALPVEDVAGLALRAPRAVVELLRPLARACGQRLVPEAPLARSIHEATADLDFAAAQVVSSLIRALADGRVDPDEKRDALGKVAGLQRRLAETERALGATA